MFFLLKAIQLETHSHDVFDIVLTETIYKIHPKRQRTRDLLTKMISFKRENSSPVFFVYNIKNWIYLT